MEGTSVYASVFPLARLLIRLSVSSVNSVVKQ
jgi:hypothetical protein